VDKLDQLWAIEQIKQLKARYFRYVDTLEDDLYLDLFTDDLEWTLFKEDGREVEYSIRGKEEYRTWRASHRDVRLVGFSVHHGHMPEIEVVDDDHARGVWAMMDYLRQPGPGRNYIGYGHYHEEYVRGQDERWRFAKVEITRLHIDRLDETW
jgi:hypothetical protein